MPRGKKALRARKERREVRNTVQRRLNAILPHGGSPRNDFIYYRKQAKRWMQDNQKSTETSHAGRRNLMAYLNLKEEELKSPPTARGGLRLCNEGQMILERIEEERKEARRSEGVTGRVKDWWPKPVRKDKKGKKAEEHQEQQEEQQEEMEVEGEEAEDEGGVPLGSDFVVALRPKYGSEVEGAAARFEGLEIDRPE